MAIFDDVTFTYSNFNGGYAGNPPTNEAEYNTLIADFPNMWTGTPVAWSVIEAAMAIKVVQKTRGEAYPSLGDQLDMLWHAMDVGDWNIKLIKTTEFYTALKAVKDANPKP